MDNSVDTNVLDGNTPACSSTQVMNLGADVPTDPTTCTTVSMLAGCEYCTLDGNLAKMVGGAVYNGQIYLLTDKPYLLNELRFGYACIVTDTEEVTKEVTKEIIDETTGETTTETTTETITETTTCTEFTTYDHIPHINSYGLYNFKYIASSQSDIPTFSIYGYDDLYISTNNTHIDSCGSVCIGCCTYELYYDENVSDYIDLITSVTYTNCISMYSCHITLGTPVLDRVYYENNTEFGYIYDLSSEKFGTKVIELQAMDSISIGCSPILITTPCDTHLNPPDIWGYYSNHGDYHYVSELRLYGDCISITANSSLCISTALYDDTTKQGTYEITKGISTMSNENGIPDLVNRIFTYTGSCTAFCAKPLSTVIGSMKDSVLYEYEVWHTIPDASNVAYTSPIDVEWLYGDPAESGIELTDGITLYYAFRAFKSGESVRVQGNLYASVVPQSTSQE